MVGLIVKETRHRGLGVFATQPFNKGDLIECCRVLVVGKEEIRLRIISSVMRNYVFEWGGKLAIPTGFGCFYNHSYQPNAIHVKYIDLKELQFYALENIMTGEEITFNYGGSPSCTDPLWFEVKNS